MQTLAKGPRYMFPDGDKGRAEINRQREKARTTLGTTFGGKTFNDTLVRGGNVPLDVLAGNVDAYLREAAVSRR